MDVNSWFDLSLFILLFILLIYVFWTVTITPLHKVYFLFHFFMMMWPLCQFAVDVSSNPHYQLIYVTLSFIVLTMQGGGWLLLSIFLTGREGRLTWSRLSLIFVPAVLISACSIWNPNESFVHPLFNGYVQREYGFLFWILIAILLGYLFFSLYFIFTTLFSTQTIRLIQKQVKITLIGILILAGFALLDLFLNVVLQGRLPIIPGLTSAGIFLSDLFFVVVIKRYNVFDLLTVAHKDVINTIPYGLLVLDENETIIEMNRALQSESYDSLNLHLYDSFNMKEFLKTAQADGDVDQFLENYENRVEAQIEIFADYMHLILQTSPINVRHDIQSGRSITFQDVSQLRYLVNQMDQKNKLLEERNLSLIEVRDALYKANAKLIDLAHTDSLTECFNRRYFTEQISLEIQTKKNKPQPFSLILFDVDYFKRINDQYGHLVGDEVLRQTVTVVSNLLGNQDLLARFGGEEFIVYLPNADQLEAYKRAEEIRTQVFENVIDASPHALSITISLGVLTIEDYDKRQLDRLEVYINELFEEVDKALYRAKENGRNCLDSVVSRSSVFG